MIDVFLLLPALLAATAPPAAPPSTLTPLALAPDRFTHRVGDTLTLRLATPNGAADAPAPWSAAPVSWFFVRVAGTQENRSAVQPIADAQGDLVTIPLGHPGVTMIGIDFAPTVRTLTRDQLRAILDAGVTPSERDRILKALPEDKPVRVRSIRSAKALVQVRGDDPNFVDAQTTGSKAGLVNEVRVLLDPLTSLIGGDITLRLHADYDKAASTLAHVANLDTGKLQQFTSDSSGIGLFHLTDPGRWRIDFMTTRLPAADPPPDADLILLSGTLVFESTRTEVPK